ncbi:MAG: hypothetical protein KIT20_03375 [Alphaproteobacteria bacterium]|nr:hypothetical protein [Alphaproteobacteria bacterium]
MPAHHPPDRRPPVIPSALDAAIWFILKSAAERQPLDPQKLNLLLYLGQASYAAAHDGAALMPGVFLAHEDGPREPNVTMALQAGLAAPPEPVLPGVGARILATLWDRYGVMPMIGLQRLVAADGLWKSTLQKIPGGEITREAMRHAYAQPRTAQAPRQRAGANRSATAASLHRADPLPRFTLDGREIKRWKPKRRIDPATLE